MKTSCSRQVRSDTSLNWESGAIAYELFVAYLCYLFGSELPARLMLIRKEAFIRMYLFQLQNARHYNILFACLINCRHV
jgi:hypothetical protein